MKFNIEVTGEELTAITKFVATIQLLVEVYPQGTTDILKAAIKSYRETLAEVQGLAPQLLKTPKPT